MPRHWLERGALAWSLWPASLVFRAAAAVRRLFYSFGVLRSHRVSVPVVVVGNLVAGGSGKTPLVLWIVTLLRASGWSPGVVSRGYGGTADSARAVSIASDPAEVGDEPVLLARRGGCPVWIGADRVAAASALLAAERGCDVLVLDDGLQHYRLARDIEIAIVDRRGFGNGFLIPAGPLREPPSRLASVDAVVSHDATVEGHAMKLEGEVLQRLGDAGTTQALSSFAGRRVHAIAGIGDPERFFAMLRAAGVQVVAHPFPDHHPFTTSDLEFGDTDPIVMTEKDAVKFTLPAPAGTDRPRGPDCWVLPVEARIDPAFAAWLLNRLGSIRSSR